MPYAAIHADLEAVKSPTRADLERIARESDKTGVLVFTWKQDDLRDLAVLPKRVTTIKINGAPRLRSLDGIETLAHLKVFVLGTSTGSAGSEQINVASYAPLEKLRALGRLLLFDVRPDDRDLSPIMRMTQLEDIDIGGVPEFGIEHYARLKASLPRASGRCLEPYVIIKGVGRCRKCGGQSVLLNGAPPRARKWVCPVCNPKLLQGHVAKWEQALAKCRSV